MSRKQFSYLQPAGMSVQTNKKHVKSTTKSTKCVSSEKNFPSYYSLQQHCKNDYELKAR